MVRTPHSPEGGEGAASWAGKAGILGKVLAWAWEEAGSVGQLQLEPQEVSELGLPDPEDSGHWICQWILRWGLSRNPQGFRSFVKVDSKLC
jgi:hypothetical protein